MRAPPHPRLATGLAHGEHDERPYLALVLAPGQDLRRRPVAPARAVGVVLDACDALAHLHAHDLVHGDVNLANLVVDDDGRAMVCDLGVARRAGEPGPVRGTHAYMAPEQVRGEPWTPATDVFALGVVLWELVAGARLFQRATSYLAAAAVVETPPPLADAALDVVAQAALAKDPATRIASVESCARADLPA
ncbi:MAG: serine/threonine-protein kinase [Kofleriaceae bacterium]